MGWRDRVLYPYSTRLDREGIYLGAAFAFAEMLLHGATTCVDFFYLQDEGNDNAEAVIQAARDTGIRLVLARTMYDWDGAPPRYREAPRGRRATRARADRRARRRRRPSPIQPAPHSPHGASPAMIRAGCEVAAGRRHALSHPRGRGPVRGRAHAGGARRHADPLSRPARRARPADDRRALRVARRRGGGPHGGARRRPRLLPVVEHDPRRRHHPHHRDAAPRRPRSASAPTAAAPTTGSPSSRRCAWPRCSRRSAISTARAWPPRRPSRWAPRRARALLGVDAGAIAVGRAADLVAVDLEHPSLHPPTSLLKSVVYAMSHAGGDGRLGARPSGRPRPAPRHPRSGRAPGPGARAHARLEARVSGFDDPRRGARSTATPSRPSPSPPTRNTPRPSARTGRATGRTSSRRSPPRAPGTQIVALEDDRVVGAVILYAGGRLDREPGGDHRDPHVAGGALRSPSRRGAGAWRRRRPHERVHSAGAERRVDGRSRCTPPISCRRPCGCTSGSASARPGARSRAGARHHREGVSPGSPALTTYAHRGRSPMRLQDFYPIIVTDKLVECRDFYVRFFDLEVAFEASWFVLTDGGRWRARERRLHAPGASVGAAGPRAVRRQGHVPRVPGRGRGGGARAASCARAPRFAIRCATSRSGSGASASSIPRACGSTWSSRSSPRRASGSNTRPR